MSDLDDVAAAVTERHQKTMQTYDVDAAGPILRRDSRPDDGGNDWDGFYEGTAQARVSSAVPPDYGIPSHPDASTCPRRWRSTGAPRTAPDGGAGLRAEAGADRSDGELAPGQKTPRQFINTYFLKHFPRIASAISALVGATVVMGWVFGLPMLQSFAPGMYPMRVNTAVCFILTGVAFWIAAGRARTDPRREIHARRIIVACAGLVVFVSGLRLCESLSGLDLRIDEALFMHSPGLNGPPRGRMAPVTAIAFTVINSALLLLHGRQGRRRLMGAGVLGALTSLLGSFTVLGYLGIAAVGIGWANLTTMALHSGLVFVLLGLACVLMAWRGAGLRWSIRGDLTAAFILGLMIFIALSLYTYKGVRQFASAAEKGGTKLSQRESPARDFTTRTFLILPLGMFIGVALFLAALFFLNAEVNERKRAETALRENEERVRLLNADLEIRVSERTAELEAANRELEAFSYSVSHDLRAPLRAVNGFAGMVMEKFAPQLPPEASRYLERIRQGGLRMGLLIDDLLEFSRLSRKALNRRTVDLANVVESVLEELGPQRAGRQIELKVGLLPPCQGDAALLKQVWINLISNAIKYTRGREPAVIEIGCTSDQGEQVYSVRDNGSGFDMQYVHKLFGVFQRLHRADEFEGTGVGLAIVQRIVLRHGGRVWAEAKPGKGAIFRFTLEAVKPAVQVLTPPSAAW